MKEYSIFLLEPDELVREAFIDVLEQEGYTLYPLENPWEAVAFVKKVKFQIALLSSNLGDFKLGDLIETINKFIPEPAIIVTALNPEVEEILSFHNSGVTGILIKPVSIAELKQALTRAENIFQERKGRNSLREEIRKIEAEKLQLQESLEKVAPYISLAELTRSLIHEIKNALTTINLSLHFINKNAPLGDPKIRKHFGLINKSVSFANELTMKLLGLTKARPEEVNFNTFVRETVEVLEPELKTRGIRILESFEEDLPEQIFDISALRQVLINLILNAKDAMQGGGQLGLRTYREDEGDKEFIVIEVADTGKGIAPQEMERIFLPSYSTKEKGTGLGLYISKKIVEEMGGEIKVESVLGKGSKFKIMLPLVKEERLFSGRQGEKESS